MRSVRNQPWTVLVVVSYALFMDYFVYGIVVPLSSCSPARISSESQAGILLGAYAIAVLIATPFFGYLGDRIGCRLPMIVGVALSAASVILFAIGDSFWLLVGARLTQGAAAAATWTAGLALVAKHFAEKRVRMMGLVMFGSTAGSVLGPAAGGWLFECGGYALPFLVTGGLLLFDLTFRLMLIKSEGKPVKREGSIVSLLKDKSVIMAGLSVAVAAIGFAVMEPLVPVHLHALGATPWQIGLLCTLSTIAYGCAAPVVDFMCQRHSISRTIAFGVLAMAAFLPLLVVSKELVTAAIALCLFNISYAFVLNPTSAELGNAVDRQGLNCYAAVYAIYNITYSLGMIGGDACVSVLTSRFSTLQILLCISGVLVLCIPVIVFGRSPSGERRAASTEGQEITAIEYSS